MKDNYLKIIRKLKLFKYRNSPIYNKHFLKDYFLSRKLLLKKKISLKEQIIINGDQTYNLLIKIEKRKINQKDKNYLISLYKKGISIIVSSIQLDTKEIPFENIKNMMPWATKIEICPAVCTMCDQDAYFTEAMFDINNATAEERVGSHGMYEPKCARHYADFKERED